MKLSNLKSLKDYFSQWKGFCPRCHRTKGRRYICVNYKPFLQNSFRVKKIRPVQNGFLLQCQNCSQYWWINLAGNKGYHAIKDISKIRHWENANLLPSDEFLKIINEIGIDSNTHVPCKVTMTDGRVFNKAIIQRTDRPPYWDYPNFACIDQVQKIEISEEALSLEIRNKIWNRPEVRMGAYIPLIVSSKLELFSIDPSYVFINDKGVLGKDLKFEKYSGESRPELNTSKQDITIFAYWPDGRSRDDLLVHVMEL